MCTKDKSDSIFELYTDTSLTQNNPLTPTWKVTGEPFQNLFGKTYAREFIQKTRVLDSVERFAYIAKDGTNLFSRIDSFTKRMLSM